MNSFRVSEKAIQLKITFTVLKYQTKVLAKIRELVQFTILNILIYQI